MENKKLINALKLEKILSELFEVFNKYKLSRGEIEFVISEMKKLAEDFSHQKNIAEVLKNRK